MFLFRENFAIRLSNEHVVAYRPIEPAASHVWLATSAFLELSCGVSAVGEVAAALGWQEVTE